MTSIILVHNGTRKGVSATPSQTLSDVLGGFCSKEGLQPDGFILEGPSGPMDMHTPVRLLGLPRRPVFTLKATDAPAPAAAAPVRVAVQTPSGRVVVSATLGTLLLHVLQEALPQATLPQLRSSTLHLLRRTLPPSALESTLTQLGVGAAGAVFRVVFEEESQPAPAGAASTPTTRPATPLGSAAGDIPPLPTPPFPPAAVANMAAAAVAELRAAAFDEDALAALGLLRRLLDNVLKSPGNAAKRGIRLANAKIGGALGRWPQAVTLLLLAGFVPTLDAPTAVLPSVPLGPGSGTLIEISAAQAAHSSALLSERPAGRLALLDNFEDTGAVLAVREAVVGEWASMSGLPVPPAPTPTPQAAAPPAPVFDIYASSMTSTAPRSGRPTRGTEGGPMQRELRALQEAEAGIVAGLPWSPSTPPPRDTTVIVPSTLPGFNPAKFLPGETPKGIPVWTPPAGTVRAQRKGDGAAVMAMMKARAEAAEKASRFRTKVERDIESAKKRLVFPAALLRVQLPDRTVVQGLFAPEESLGAVEEWLLGCLAPGVGGPGDLELYVTPPRRVLPLGDTLQELGLLPAALLYASGPCLMAAAQPDGDGDVTLPSTAAGNVSVGGHAMLASTPLPFTAYLRAGLAKAAATQADSLRVAAEANLKAVRAAPAPAPAPAPGSSAGGTPAVAGDAAALREARLEAMAKRLLGGKKL